MKANFWRIEGDHDLSKNNWVLTSFSFLFHETFFLEIFNVQIASVFFSFFLFCVHCRNFWIYLNQKRRMLLLRNKATLMCPLQKKVTLMCQKLNQELILPVNQRNQKGQWVAFIIKHVVLTKNSWLSWIAYYCQSCFGSDKSLIFSPQDRSVLAFVPNSFYLFYFFGPN